MGFLDINEKLSSALFFKMLVQDFSLSTNQSFDKLPHSCREILIKVEIYLPFFSKPIKSICPFLCNGRKKMHHNSVDQFQLLKGAICKNNELISSPDLEEIAVVLA